VSDESDVFLKPGIYIIKDGPLKLHGNGKFYGENVGFYFEGDKADLDVNPTMTLDLTAPKSGPLSGILFFEDRSTKIGRAFAIRSKNAERLEGTIYLPNGRLFVDKASKIGQASKWTAVVARYFEIVDGPDIQMNSDYAGSDIPVPSGIGPNTELRLTN
jgi:hypothetical protein